MFETTPVDNGFADAEKSFAGHCLVASAHFIITNIFRHSHDNIHHFSKYSVQTPNTLTWRSLVLVQSPFNIIAFIHLVIYHILLHFYFLLYAITNIPELLSRTPCICAPCGVNFLNNILFTIHIWCRIYLRLSSLGSFTLSELQQS